MLQCSLSKKCNKQTNKKMNVIIVIWLSVTISLTPPVFISVVLTAIAPVPWGLRPVIGRILRRLLGPGTGTILRVRSGLASLSARLRSFFKRLRSLKDFAPSFKALRTSLKSMRPSLKGGLQDLMAPYDTPAPQVGFYDAPKPSYGAPSPSYKGQGFKRSVKQYFLYQITMKLRFFSFDTVWRGEQDPFRVGVEKLWRSRVEAPVQLWRLRHCDEVGSKAAPVDLRASTKICVSNIIAFHLLYHTWFKTSWRSILAETVLEMRFINLETKLRHSFGFDKVNLMVTSCQWLVLINYL